MAGRFDSLVLTEQMNLNVLKACRHLFACFIRQRVFAGWWFSDGGGEIDRYEAGEVYLLFLLPANISVSCFCQRFDDVFWGG